MEPLPLRTVRPFVFGTVRLADGEAGREPAASDASELAQQFVASRVERMLLEAGEQLTGELVAAAPLRPGARCCGAGLPGMWVGSGHAKLKV